MLIDFYGEVLDVNGQEAYFDCDYEYDYDDENEDCRKENDAIFCEPRTNDYDYDSLPL